MTQIELISLHDYVAPSQKADESIRQFGTWLTRLFRPPKVEPHMSAADLERADLRLLGEIAGPPACGPAIEMLQVGLADWMNNPNPIRFTQFIVLPGAEPNSLVESWAKRHGHSVIQPPSFEQLIASDPENKSTTLGPIQYTLLPATDEERSEKKAPPILVIPQLERWFVRHHRGLDRMRCLLDALAVSKRHVVVGCNSWAWEFLRQTIGVGAVLNNPLTLPPFQAQELHRWFSELAADSGGDPANFLRASDKKPVLEVSDSGTLASDYLHSLAAHSLGIPWIAWHLWRSSLRTTHAPNTESESVSESVENARDSRGKAETKSADVTIEDSDTIWLSEYNPPLWPADCISASLLILHALLIHGPLSEKQLMQVLPSTDFSTILAGLETRRFVSRKNSLLHCQPLAYATIRNKLLAAGISRTLF